MKRKIKKIVIERCVQCPSSYWDTDLCCLEKGLGHKVSNELGDFPEWCPLEDYKGAKELKI